MIETIDEPAPRIRQPPNTPKTSSLNTSTNMPLTRSAKTLSAKYIVALLLHMYTWINCWWAAIHCAYDLLLATICEHVRDLQGCQKKGNVVIDTSGVRARITNIACIRSCWQNFFALVLNNCLHILQMCTLLTDPTHWICSLTTLVPEHPHRVLKAVKQVIHQILDFREVATRTIWSNQDLGLLTATCTISVMRWLGYDSSMWW